MMDVSNVREPAWADADHTSIICEVKFDAFADYVPFHAMPGDPHEHGREIFDACVAGEFGEIGPYVPPESQQQGA
jgi:hypothetical protein